jgi:hypothetical protein
MHHKTQFLNAVLGAECNKIYSLIFLKGITSKIQELKSGEPKNSGIDCAVIQCEVCPSFCRKVMLKSFIPLNRKLSYGDIL